MKLRLVDILLLGVIAASAAAGLTRLPALPDPLPVHFDVEGRADGFAPRSAWQVVRLPALALGANLLLAALGWVLLRERRRRFRVEEGTSGAMGVERRRLTRRLLTWVRTVLVLLTAGLLQAIVLHGAGTGQVPATLLRAVPAVLLAAIAAGVAVWVAQVRELRRAFADVPREPR